MFNRRKQFIANDAYSIFPPYLLFTNCVSFHKAGAVNIIGCGLLIDPQVFKSEYAK